MAKKLSVILLAFVFAIGADEEDPAAGPNTCNGLEEVLNVTANIKAEFVESHFDENVPIRNEYDFVIIGASPAGCVLANRLSEERNFSVLLLEAGSPENPLFSNVPMGAPNLQSTDFNWNYATEQQSDACLAMRGKRCKWPHGRGLGGSSLINYMIYTRGNPRDFDDWTNAGISGWSYDEVLPYFQKFEKSNIPEKDSANNNQSLGRNGLLSIELAKFRTQLADAFVNSAMQLNYSNVNYNAGDQIGVSYLQSTTQNGWRHTAARAFLSPIKQRTNLDISLRSWVTKLIFNSNGDRIKSVKFYRNKKEWNVKVKREAILSAGAFESPKLLMLSGIGPVDHLNDMKIKVIKDLPVGETLFEHMAVLGPIFTADNLTDGLINMNDVLQPMPIVELLKGKGPLTSTGIESLLYMKSNISTNPDPSVADIELLQSFATVAFDTARGTRDGVGLTEEAYEAIFKPLENRRAFQVLPLLLHPRSKGFLKLKSRNPFHHPLFYPNFFNDTRDIDVLLEGIREAIRIVSQQPFQDLGVNVYNASVPGCEHSTFDSDDYWRCYIRHLSATLHHQIATCKMGPRTDKTSVVDSSAKVHDIKNLRVADISIIPVPPSGHTAAFSFMIGEKIADMIRSDWKIETNPVIQNFVREQRSIDWLYQDPNHTTEARITSTTSKFNYPFAFMLAPTTTTKPMSASNLKLLKELNMETLRRNSETFKNTTVGDVGVILWGSPSISQKIDFKTKLAEHLNATDLENKTISTTRKPKIIRVTQIVAEIMTSTMSNMEKILAMAPSLDEDEVNKFKLSTTKRKGAKIDKEHVAMDQTTDTEQKVIEEQISMEANQTIVIDDEIPTEPLPFETLNVMTKEIYNITREQSRKLSESL